MKKILSKVLIFRRNLLLSLKRMKARIWIFFRQIIFNIKEYITLNKILVLSFCLSGILIIFITEDLNKYFLKDEYDLKSLNSFLLTVGGALVGATAVIFTLVLFVLQITFEKTSYGLFRRLNSDRNILIYFILAFLLAISFAVTSIFDYSKDVSLVIFSSFWMIVGIIYLLLLSYKRALDLINPITQLEILLNETKEELSQWKNTYKNVAPLFNNIDELNTTLYEDSHDILKMNFFASYSNWTEASRKSIKYAITYANSSSKNNDHEISKTALNIIVVINKEYIKVKEKTFFNTDGLFQSSNVTDTFINDTLEQLRKLLKTAIERNDEDFIEQILNTYVNLVNEYSKIDYLNEIPRKTHAHLANSYLISSIELILTSGMVDVLMEGVRCLKNTSRIFLLEKDDLSVLDNISCLSKMSIVYAVKDEYGPVTNEVFNVYSLLILELMKSQNLTNVKLLFEKVDEAITLTTKLLILSPNKPLNKGLITFIDAYYSDKFISELTILTNSLLSINDNNEIAKNVINNIEEWANQIYINKRELLPISIDNNSSLTISLIQWIGNITKLLMSISTALNCSETNKEKLENHAIWLICSLTFIERDKKTVTYVQHANIIEVLFEVCLKAEQRNCEKAFEVVQKTILDWGFTGGSKHTGWNILEQSILANIVLLFKTNLLLEDDLINQIKERLQSDIIFEDGLLKNTIESFKKIDLHYSSSRYDEIEYHLYSIEDKNEGNRIISEIVNMLEEKL